MGARRRDILLSLGYHDLLAYDADPSRYFAFGTDPGIRCYVDLATLWANRPDVVFICTSPETHLALAWEAHIRGVRGIFLEKPLATEMPCDAFRLLSDDVTMVGCNWRFHPGPIAVKRWLSEGRIGQPLSATLTAGYYLPSVRADYRECYAARAGAILDVGAHMVDLALDWFGPGHLVFSRAQSAESIGLPDIDGLAQMALLHEVGVPSYVAVNFVQRNRAVGSVIVGSKGAIGWGWERETAWCLASDESRCDTVTWDDTADNQMFVDETAHFLDCVRTGSLTCNPVSMASDTLRILLEAKRQWRG